MTRPVNEYDAVASRSAAVVIRAYSTSFGWASRLLGRTEREHVGNIYALVRVADEIVDDPQQSWSAEDRGRMLDALEAERAALRSRDAEALLTAVRRKGDALDRATHASDHVGAADPAGTPGESLRALAARCRELNDANGALIRGQRRRIDGALRVLVGNTGNAAEVYGRDGGTQFMPARRRPLASF